MSRSRQKGSRYLRNSSMTALWNRLQRQEQAWERRMRQASELDGEAVRIGLELAIPRPPYTLLRTGCLTRFADDAIRRRNRSTSLVEAAIARLRQGGATRFRGPDVVAASQHADPEGRGVSLSVLYQNSECARLVAKANGKLEHQPTHVPASARRLGRRALVRRIADLETALGELTTAIAAANEQILARRTLSLRQDVAAALHEIEQHQVVPIGRPSSRWAAAVPQRMRTASSERSPF